MLGMAFGAKNKVAQEEAPVKEGEPENAGEQKYKYTEADLAINEDMQAELDRLHNESYNDNRDDLYD